MRKVNIKFSFVCVIGIIYLIILIANSFNRGEDNSAYSYNSNIVTSSREALTDEEAEELSGTGYNNTRPNSSAENMEIAAAKVKCKECGKHSDNGSNSLCDSCQKKKLNNK